MTEAQFVEAVQETWLAAWLAMHPDIPTTFSNETFTAPANWVRLVTRHTVSHRLTMGLTHRRWSRIGLIAVQLFGEVNVGEGCLAQLADDTRSILEGIVFGGGQGWTDAGTTNDAVKDTDGRWFMKLVTIPFWYQQQR